MTSASTLPGKALDTTEYSVGGRTPRFAARPESREELSALLREAAARGLAALPWGGGTAVTRDAAPERYDLAIDLRAFDRIVEYDPEDMTLTAECGVTLATLAATLAARGQELPLEGGDPERATLGGVLATNASGPRRLRFGAPRDRLLGARYALADGAIVRTGGRVVKNVSGHAVHRMLCGSRGALGAIVEASLKLVPAPAARRALVFDANAEDLADATRWAALPRLEPSAFTVLAPRTAGAIDALGVGSSFAIVVVLEDDAPWVDRQTSLVEAAIGPARRRLEGDDVRALTSALTELPERWPRRLALTTSWNSPAALGVWKGAASSELLFHVLAGRLQLDPAAVLPATELHRLAGRGWEVVEHRGCDGSLPSQAASLGQLRRRVREALDPGGVWSFGPAWERGD